MRNRTSKTKRIVAAFAAVAFVGIASAEEKSQEEPKPWTGSLGISLLSTSGNTRTFSLGADLNVKRLPEPWGIEIGASLLRSSKRGIADAERYSGSIRGIRALSDRISLFLGALGERDRFSGYNLRMVFDAGGALKALTGPVHTLAFDLGLTWTREEPIAARNRDFPGGLVGLTYGLKVSETSLLGEKARLFLDFKEASNWRAISETSLAANIISHLALKATFELRYNHLPQPGFVSTDTATKISLVASF